MIELQQRYALSIEHENQMVLKAHPLHQSFLATIIVWLSVLICSNALGQTNKTNKTLKTDLPKAAPATQEPTEVEGFESIELQGWTLLLNKRLKADKPELTATMLELMDGQLARVAEAVPPTALKHLRGVRIWINPIYEGVRPTAEYHPNGDWLRKNDRKAEMAKCVEITNVDRFEFENTRMPYLMLHELAHAYHDQVLGFRNTKIRETFQAAEANGGYEQVDRFTGREIIKDKAYAMSNHKEYFAESTEAFFGKNDFFPFNLEELQEHDPNMVELLKKVWGVEE